MISVLSVFVVGLSFFIGFLIDNKRQSYLKATEGLEGSQTISTEEPSKDTGGAIFLDVGTKYDMYGGSINGKSAEYGGTVYVSAGATFTMYGGTINDCWARSGGAIYVESGGMCVINGGTIKNCLAKIVDGKSTSAYGGAIFIESGATLVINDNFTIEDCSAYTAGGGIYNLGTVNASSSNSITITNCDVSLSTVGSTYYGGGGIYNKGILNFNLSSQLNISDCDIINGNGGAICNVSSNNLILPNKTIIDNCSSILDGITSEIYNPLVGMGGAIYSVRPLTMGQEVNNSIKGYDSSEDYFEIKNCNANFGGAIGSGKAGTSTFKLVLNNGVIENCTSSQAGSAIYLDYLNKNGATLTNVTITGSGSSANGVAIRCRGTSAFSVPVELTNCSFVDNVTATTGAEVLMFQYVSLTLNNTEIINDKTKITAVGPAIDLSVGKITMNNSVISGHGSKNTQGGALKTSGCEITISNSEISNNEGSNGVIYSGGKWVKPTDASVTVEASITIDSSSIIKDNTAVSGGAFYVLGTTVNIYGNRNIINNTATSNGGVIYMASVTLSSSGETVYSSLTATNTYLCNNKAANGGAIYATSKSNVLLMEGSVVSNNEATSNGGGIYLNNSNLECFNTAISIFDNTSNNNGGGIYATSSSVISISEGSSVNRNTAKYTGGGIYLNASELQMGGGFTVNENQALNSSGGGIYANNSIVTVGFYEDENYLDHRISGNQAPLGSGGGIYAVSSSKISIMGGTSVDGNTAKSNGGGIYLNGSELELDGGFTINENQALNSNGGGIYANNSRVIVGLNENENYPDHSISGNKAPLGSGGGIYITTSKPTTSGTYGLELYKVTIADNFAKNTGGVYIGSSTAKLFNENTIIESNHSTSRGGLSLDKSEVIMDAGYIRNNTSGATYNGTTDTWEWLTNSGAGAGVYVYGATETAPSVFTMNSGYITGNKAGNQAGGLGLSGEYSVAYLNGGEISDNSSGTYIGGVGIVKSTIYLRGTRIERNYVEAIESTNTNIGHAPGVSVDEGGRLIMTGGSISENYIKDVSNGLGGYLTNEAHGGGLFINRGSYVEMSGGTIANNDLSGAVNGNKTGGQIFITYDTSTVPNPEDFSTTITRTSTFKMSGGEIIGSTTYAKYGGIIASLGVLELLGGTITNNNGTYDSSEILAGGTINIGGDFDLVNAPITLLKTDVYTYAEDDNGAPFWTIFEGTSPYINVAYELTSDNEILVDFVDGQYDRNNKRFHIYDIDNVSAEIEKDEIVPAANGYTALESAFASYLLYNEKYVTFASGLDVDYKKLKHAKSKYINGLKNNNLYFVEISSSGNSLSLSDNSQSFTGLVLIPEEINGVSVTNIASNGFESKNISGVVLPSSLTSIGANAFEGCLYLEAVIIENKESVITLGSNAINNVNENFVIYVPVEIYNSYIEDAEWFKYIDHLEEYVYEGESYLDFASTNTNLNSFTSSVVDEVSVLGLKNSSDARTLVRIPSIVINLTSQSGVIKRVVDIAESAFDGNVNLQSVYIGNAVKYIRHFAFRNCSNLKLIKMSNSIDYLEDVFSGCSSVEEVYLPSPEDWMTLELGRYTSTSNPTVANGKEEIVYFWTDEGYQILTEITVPSGVYCGYASFMGIEQITSVIIQDGASIGTSAFSGTGLTDLIIGNNVTLANKTLVFYGTDIKKLTIGSGLKFSDSELLVTKDVFAGCSNIEELETNTNLGNEAFSGCVALATVIIGEGVTSIGAQAFNNCTSIQNIYLPSVEDWLDVDIGSYTGNPAYGPNVEKIYFDGVLTTEITITKDVKRAAFSGFSYLTQVTFAEGVTSIGVDSLWSCTGLNQTLQLPSTLKEIKDFAFSGCGSLYGDLIIPNSVEEIGPNAFGYCSNLNGTLQLSSNSNLTTIGNNAFAYCENLKTVIIPNNISSIGTNTFTGCSRLQTLIIVNKTEIVSPGIDAFVNCDENLTVYVPQEMYSRYLADEKWSVYNIENYVYENESYLSYEYSTSLSTFAVSSGSEACVAGFVTGYEESQEVVDIPDNIFVGSLDSDLTIRQVTTINEGAFDDSNIIRLIISKFINSITGAIARGSSISIIKINKENSIFDDLDSNLIFDKTTDVLIQGSQGTRSIPADKGIIYIGNEAFSGIGYKTTDLIIPEGVTSIGLASFNGATISDIILPTTIDYIASNAFYVNGLENVINKSKQELYVGYNIFSSESKINLYVLSDYIDYYEDCENLKTLNLNINPFVISDEYYLSYDYGEIDPIAIVPRISISVTGRKTDSSQREIVIPRFVLNGNYLYNVDDVADGAFQNSNITSVKFTEGIRVIQKQAFYNCNFLTTITFANSIIEIGNSAFVMTPITSLSLPSNLRIIGKAAFNGCQALRSVNIPASVQEIRGAILSGMNNNYLEEITVDYNNENYSDLGFNVIMEKSTGKLIQGCAGTYLDASSDNFYLISSIGDDAFYGVRFDTSTYLYLDVEGIGANAFADSANLDRVWMSGALNYIGADAFVSSNVSTFVIEGYADIGSINSLNTGAEEVEIFVPDSLGEYYLNHEYLQNDGNIIYNIKPFVYEANHYLSFDGGIVTGLKDASTETDIIIPKYVYDFEYQNIQKVTTIGGYAFSGEDITSVYIPETITTIETHAFEEIYSFQHIYIPSTVTTIESEIFYYWQGSEKTIYTDASSDLPGWASDWKVWYVWVRFGEQIWSKWICFKAYDW